VRDSAKAADAVVGTGSSARGVEVVARDPAPHAVTPLRVAERDPAQDVFARDPTFSRARRSAMFSTSVSASIRITSVCAKRYRTSCRCASVPMPVPRASGSRLMPMFQAPAAPDRSRNGQDALGHRA
jgi:hypothetical protein